MIEVSFNASAAYLLNDEPNWVGTVSVEAQLPTSYERGLSGRETRRPTGDTLRLAVKWESTLTSSMAITALRNSLQALTVEPVLCPFWPGLTAPGDEPACSTEFYVILDDTAAPSIEPAANAPFDRPSYPLLLGYLKSPAVPELMHDALATVEFDFEESDASLLTPPAFAAGNALVDGSGAARPLFPFAPDWSSAPQSGEAEQDITRTAIGVVRALQVQYFAQRSRRKANQGFLLQGTDPLNLLSFFLSTGGETHNFWLPVGISEAALTANVAAVDTAITVDNPAALGGNVFIALNDNRHLAALKVTGVAGNNWNLAAAPGIAFNAAVTRIESLMLARFDAIKLVLSFERPDLARITLQFKETPWEPAAVDGEAFGTTMGALPATAMLYKFTLTIPAGNVVSYFTGFERNLSDGVNTWLSAPLENNEITEADTLEQQTVTLKSRNFANNPLALMFPFQVEFPLLVEIFEGDVTGNDVGNLRCYFAGEVSKADIEPPYITATCDSMRSIFDRNIPRQLFQPGCNWVLFESNCGLSPADWTWTATVVSYDAPSCTLLVNTVASTNTTAVVAHLFAAGYLQVTTAGNSQYRMVSDNTVIAGGQMSLNLAEPLAVAAVAGDPVKIFPGCDGRYHETCIALFNNGSRHGGFPYMPVNNPTVFKLANNGSGGKK